MLWNVAAWLVLVASAFRGPVGETSFDTKSDLAVSPGEFLLRSLHLWNDEASFGELQNQAYGYLFPQGSFAWVGQLLGIPAWVVQRLWVAVVLVIAYEGVRRLFLSLPGRLPGATSYGAAVLAGLVYAAAPRVGGIAGVLSSEATPPALVPWAVLAVVAYARGRISARTAGLATGVAVLLMGGVNAVAVIACLPLLVLAVVGAVPAGARLAHRRVDRRRGGRRGALVAGAAAPARPLQPALPGLHRDQRGNDRTTGLGQRRPGSRALGGIHLEGRRAPRSPAPSTCTPPRSACS